MAGSAFHLTTIREPMFVDAPSLQVTVTSYGNDGRKFAMTTFTPGPFDDMAAIWEECDRLKARAEQGEQLRLT